MSQKSRNGTVLLVQQDSRIILKAGGNLVSIQYRVRVVVSVWEEIKLPLEQFSVIRVD